jgi:hypothetical protein
VQDDVGTPLIDSLLSEHGIAAGEVSFNNNVPFPTSVAAFISLPSFALGDR